MNNLSFFKFRINTKYKLIKLRRKLDHGDEEENRYAIVASKLFNPFALMDNLQQLL